MRCRVRRATPSFLFTALMIIAALLQLQGCTTNPVTGERQLMLVSQAQEYAIGEEQYGPAIQSQGGEYYLDPELTAYVQRVGQKLAAVSDQPELPYEFVIINSSIPNAWALPSGKIAINRGLLTELANEAQLAAVLGHEIVHAAARHSAQRLQQGLLLNAGLAGIGLMVSDNNYRDIILGGASLGAGLTLARYGRGHELESDHYGMQYMAAAGYDPQAAVELQEIFVELSKGQQANWLEGLFASHPPSEERVAKNRRHAQSLLVNLPFRGDAEYAKVTAPLRKREAAYKAHDEGVAALAKGDVATALEKANAAVKLAPREAMFHALRGDVYRTQGNEAEALKNYNRAVELYPQHYSYLLKRGVTQQEMGSNAAALQDLQQSAALLPTSIAFYAMGEAALASNRPRDAYQYFQTAGQGGGELGAVARQRASLLASHLRSQSSRPSQ